MIYMSGRFFGGRMADLGYSYIDKSTQTSVSTGKHKEVQASTNMYKRGKTLI